MKLASSHTERPPRWGGRVAGHGLSALHCVARDCAPKLHSDRARSYSGLQVLQNVHFHKTLEFEYQSRIAEYASGSHFLAASRMPRALVPMRFPYFSASARSSAVMSEKDALGVSSLQ